MRSTGFPLPLSGPIHSSSVVTDPALQRQYLRLMGIDVWLRREGGTAAPASCEAAPQVPAADDGAWQALQETVRTCRACALHQGRTQTVFGVGDPRADWMIIGEAPGAEEDKQGEPFVGQAGRLLNAMLEAMGLQRSGVFIANILKCRPPNNRDPSPGEVAMCENYLRQQIEMVQPKLILALGRIAAWNLLKVDTPIGRMRGRHYHFPGTDIPLVVTYHPGYLLRSPREKRKSWQDLRFAMRIFRDT